MENTLMQPWLEWHLLASTWLARSLHLCMQWPSPNSAERTASWLALSSCWRQTQCWEQWARSSMLIGKCSSALVASLDLFKAMETHLLRLRRCLWLLPNSQTSRTKWLARCKQPLVWEWWWALSSALWCMVSGAMSGHSGSSVLCYSWQLFFSSAISPLSWTKMESSLTLAQLKMKSNHSCTTTRRTVKTTKKTRSIQTLRGHATKSKSWFKATTCSNLKTSECGNLFQREKHSSPSSPWA